MSFVGSTASADPVHMTSQNSQIDVYDGRPFRYVIRNNSPWTSNIRIVGHSYLNQSCGSDVVDYAELTKSAVHGMVCVRYEDGNVKYDHTGSTAKCLEAPSRFVVIYYEPSNGFIGTDSFNYSVENSAIGKNIVAEVTVEVAPADAGRKTENNANSDLPQALGRLPVCPPLIN